ncbi:hypothetical protein EEL49_13010 [Muribaculaceae bacterium Isolate-104 (HZI)]|nr:hypothetical protein EEL49_13010 [Muribaculaceae bacterium Isolate-104 (HZI)]
MHWKCLKSRTINSALNEDAKNVCGALNICTKSLRIVKSHASALLKNGEILTLLEFIPIFAARNNG